MSTTGPDDFERYVREVMHSRDSRPAGFSAGQVVAGGRRRRRSRTVAASGLALVAFAVVLGAGMGAATLAGGQGRGGDNPGVTPAATTPSTSSTPAAPFSAAPAGPPRVVTAPGSTDIGGGFRLKLTADSVQLVDPDGGSVGPDYIEPKEPDTTSLMIAGRAVASLYSGPHEVASALVTCDTGAYPATILRLAGHAGWSVAYVVLPTGVTCSSKVSITVFDAAGSPLATDPPSGVTPQAQPTSPPASLPTTGPASP